MAEESDRRLVTPLIFNDEPVGRDETAYFQFEPYADTFAHIIAARDTRTPLTIGVHGEWGSGKTTLMRRIQEAGPGFLASGVLVFWKGGGVSGEEALPPPLSAAARRPAGWRGRPCACSAERGSAEQAFRPMGLAVDCRQELC